jgi:hypothetical protein
MFALPLLMAFFTADPFDRSTIAIEALPTDPKLDKIVLIAGLPSPKLKTGEHEYFAGCAALMKLLQQTPGVFPVLVKDGLPKNPETLKGAKAVVLFVEGADTHIVFKNGLAAQLDDLAKAGTGIVHLHSAIDYNKDFHERSKSWAGAVWEKGYSLRTHHLEAGDGTPDSPRRRAVRHRRWLAVEAAVRGRHERHHATDAKHQPQRPTGENQCHGSHHRLGLRPATRRQVLQLHRRPLACQPQG